MRAERGYTLPELIVVLAIISLLITVTITYALPWFAREDMRSAVYQVQVHLQVARVQAVTRNHACAFRVDTSTGHVQVYDLNDPSLSTDDILLTEFALPSTVSFSDPGGGSAVTLTSLSSTLFQATFGSDGSVTAGAGVIMMTGGNRYNRLSLFAAGGVRVDIWNGSAWVNGA